MKTLSSVFAITIISTICLSQQSQAQVSIGLRTGVNFAKFNIDSNDPDYDDFLVKNKVGVNLALLVNFALGETPLSIQIEPGYSQRGMINKEDNTHTSNGTTYRSVDKFTLSANYFELPVLLKFSPKIGPVEAMVSVGPELRFLYSPMKYTVASQSYEDGVLTDNSTESGNMEWEENQDPGKTDIGLVGGLGVAVPLGKLKLFAEGRYHYGAAFINKTSTDLGSSVTIYEKFSNRGLSVSVGILYRLGD